ncbi:tetratricopeptide repeat protein [Olivibacter domesticus]|uniref:Outer membrane protein, YaiO family n=1 Tax=Olivibacter domesticus TaxID=407022 RepID=A0A1H7KWR3_OLID1|nr:tetratricopeptide repeat protein [Olivibacter domesticus]SEK91283.1 outer membrane protein, YaiO family [Olivibacter domesticus]
MKVVKLYFVILFLSSFIRETQAQLFERKDQADTWMTRAQQALKKGNYPKAVEYAEHAFSERKNDADVKLLLVRSYILNKQGVKARPLVREIIREHPEYRDAYLYGINIELNSRQLAAAESIANQAIQQFPNDIDFMVKRLSILDESQKYIRAEDYAENLLRKYPDNQRVKDAYTAHYVQSAQHYRRENLEQRALQDLNKALAIDPGHHDARELLKSINKGSENINDRLQQIEAALESKPGDYSLLLEKLNILRETYHYAEALTIWQQLHRLFPSDTKVNGLEVELRKEAATFYAQTDPYSLYISLLDKNPNDIETLRKLIAWSLSRGAYREGLSWVNKGLRRNPNAFELLAQKVDLLEYTQRFTEAAALAQQLYQQRRTDDWKERVVYLKNASAREYIAQQQYPEALDEVSAGLVLNPQDPDLLRTQINIYALQKRINLAINAIRTLNQVAPSNRLRLQEGVLLIETKQYDEGLSILHQLLEAEPTNEEIKQAWLDQNLAIGRDFMQQEEFQLAVGPLRNVLQVQANNRDALDYLVNLYSGINQVDSALFFADQALQAFPDDKGILLKKSAVLTQMKRYQEANAITEQLIRRYPYTKNYLTSYLENQYLAASAYKKEGELDSAIAIYQKLLSYAPKDSTALRSLTDYYLEQKDYSQALTFAERGVAAHPELGVFMLRKAQALEGQANFAAASAAADSAFMQAPTLVNRSYADYLKSKTLKNQFGLFFLKSSYDYSDENYDIATIEYRRFTKHGSWATRINYAGRKQGTGLQGELELYYNHNKSLYSYATAAYASKLVFPEWRLGYSLFKNLKKEWEVELGVRYLKADSNYSAFSGVASVGKTIGDFWFNLRGYAIFDQENTNSSFNLGSRYYMNRRQDYFSVNLGLGTSPDDRSRLVLFPNLQGLLTRFVGAGFNKTFAYRTTVGINATWITQKIGDDIYQNQHDIYFTLMRKF